MLNLLHLLQAACLPRDLFCLGMSECALDVQPVCFMHVRAS